MSPQKLKLWGNLFFCLNVLNSWSPSLQKRPWLVVSFLMKPSSKFWRYGRSSQSLSKATNLYGTEFEGNYHARIHVNSSNLKNRKLPMRSWQVLVAAAIDKSKVQGPRWWFPLDMACHCQIAWTKMGSGGQFLAYGMVGVLGQSGGARKKRAVKMDLGIRWSERGRFRLDKWQFMVFDEILQQIST